MTTGEPGLTEEPRAAAAANGASGAKRIVEWFWRGEALAEKRRSLPERSARATLLAQRAHACADLALNTSELARSVDADRSALSSPGEATALAEASACDFHRQSSYWSLCALAARSNEAAGTSYDEAVWDALDEQLLTAAAPGERSELLRMSLRRGSFVYFAELPPDQRAAVSEDLRRLADSLLLKVDERTRAIQGVLLQRASRLSLLLLLLLLVGVGLVWERKTREARSDLAQGAEWRTSSKYESMNCHSPEQTCADSPAIFFHTNEEKDPWIEFDLGKERQVSAVQVENRPDCCSDRAIPLTVEVSDNHKKWRTVARQDADFKTWRATFSATNARWVRLRVHKVSYLHLAHVGIFP